MRILISGLAALSLLAVAAAPAEARHRHRDRVDVDAGDVVAGALVIGAIAAIAASSNNNEKQDRAVNACSAEAESRIGGRISDIYGVSKRKGYYTVEGAVEADDGPREHFTCTIRRGILYGFRSGRGEY
jgi:hypothetical protein